MYSSKANTSSAWNFWDRRMPMIAKCPSILIKKDSSLSLKWIVYSSINTALPACSLRWKSFQEENEKDKINVIFCPLTSIVSLKLSQNTSIGMTTQYSKRAAKARKWREHQICLGVQEHGGKLEVTVTRCMKADRTVGRLDIYKYTFFQKLRRFVQIPNP